MTAREVCLECEKLRVELGLLQAAGDQMRDLIEDGSYTARQWDQVRSKGGEASADSPLSDRHPGGSGR